MEVGRWKWEAGEKGKGKLTTETLRAQRGDGGILFLMDSAYDSPEPNISPRGYYTGIIFHHGYKLKIYLMGRCRMRYMIFSSSL